MSRPSGARLVAIGILTSRIFGLVRQKAFAWFFGVSAFTDVINTAFRLPNVLQNLLGEQSLSAAFIPIYSRMVEEGKEEEARRFAGAIFGLLVAVVSLLVVLGVLLARPIVTIAAAGFLKDAALVEAGEMAVDRLELAVRAVRIVLPMTGLLVLSAWCLGILNSHRRFLLPYMAPVFWNVAIIGMLAFAAFQSGGIGAPGDAATSVLENWLFAVFWGGLLGGFLQFAVQLPAVFSLLGGFRPSLSLAAPGVRESLKMFGPALLGRGVVQLAFYVNVFLASLLAPGAPAALAFAMMLYNLPLSAFGMSVAAGELPELSRASPEAAVARVRERLGTAIRQSVFVMAPATCGYLAFGYLVTWVIYSGGAFTVEHNALVAAVLGAASLGLIAAATSRILQNTFFALRDTRTPAKIAAVRLFVGALAGAGLMVILDQYKVGDVFYKLDGSVDLRLGAVALAFGGAVGDWLELILLRRQLVQRIPGLKLPVAAMTRMFMAALVAALLLMVVWRILLPRLLAGMGVALEPGLLVTALVLLPAFAMAYLGTAYRQGWPELDYWAGRFLRRG